METFNTTIFPRGEKASSEYFSGGTAWVQIIKPNENQRNCQIGNVTFEPGCRNNWHSHGGGQILIVTGKGFYQEKGKPVQVLHPGDVVTILPEVIHWHGALRTVGSPILQSIPIPRMEWLNGWSLHRMSTITTYQSNI